MADTLTTLGLVTLAQMFRGDVVRQINRQVTALKFIPIKPGEGKNVAWAPEADGQIAENYSEGADAANFGGDAQTSAILSWALYRANIHVSNLSLDGSASSADPAGNHQLWARNVVNASSKLASKLNGEIYTGAGTGTLICGLDTAIGNDANTYATIDRTVGANAFWKPTVIAPGAPVKPTMALIRDDIRKIYEASGENPDVALCSPAVFNSVGNLFDATRRQMDTVHAAGGPVKLEFGYHALEVDGTMFVKDKDATAAQIYYLNTAAMKLQYLPSASQAMLLERAGLQVQADDGFGEVPLGFKYEMLAKTGPSEKAEVLSTCQLKIERSNKFGVRKNVDVT